MSPKSFLLTEPLHDYLMANGTRPDAVQQRLIDETAALGGISGMQIAPEQGVFLSMLCQVAGVRRAVEVGTFTGYSALCIARALPADGSLLCCDVNEEWTAIGRRYWDEAGVGARITLELGPAIDTLRALPAGEAFDLAFIDADKPGYARYFEELVPRMRPGALVLVDNVLWSGRVIEPDDDSTDTVALRAFNDQVVADPRVESVMLAVGDGLSVIAVR